jgi:hypothetical protein
MKAPTRQKQHLAKRPRIEQLFTSNMRALQNARGVFCETEEETSLGAGWQGADTAARKEGGGE